jgi:hypothetical protein
MTRMVVAGIGDAGHSSFVLVLDRVVASSHRFSQIKHRFSGLCPRSGSGWIIRASSFRVIHVIRGAF